MNDIEKRYRSVFYFVDHKVWRKKEKINIENPNPGRRGDDPLKVNVIKLFTLPFSWVLGPYSQHFIFLLTHE